MRVIVGIALCLTLVMGGLVYFFAVDGRIPQSTDFNPSIADIRRLANAPAEERPSAIEVEFLAEDRLPFLGLQAGLDLRGATMARSAFRLKSNHGALAARSYVRRSAARVTDVLTVVIGLVGKAPISSWGRPRRRVKSAAPLVVMRNRNVVIVADVS